MRRAPWLKLRKKTDPELPLQPPIRLGNFGYPALTPAIKAKIFGLNSARVYGIDPNAIRCKVTQTTLARFKEIIDGELGGRRWAFQEMGGPRSRREFLNMARLSGGRPG